MNNSGNGGEAIFMLMLSVVFIGAWVGWILLKWGIKLVWFLGNYIYEWIVAYRMAGRWVKSDRYN